MALLFVCGGCASTRGGADSGAAPRTSDSSAPGGQWAFAVKGEDGTAPKPATVSIAVDRILEWGPHGRPVRDETVVVSHTFAEGTTASDIAFFLKHLLEGRLRGSRIELRHEKGSESLFLKGADLARIAAHSDDESAIEVNMSCEVGPPEGRLLTAIEIESATPGR